ncbi:MAG: hypothetical protein IPH10_08555 [bacterium]|nr:hypothetical protein [bacterium]
MHARDLGCEYDDIIGHRPSVPACYRRCRCSKLGRHRRYPPEDRKILNGYTCAKTR